MGLFSSKKKIYVSSVVYNMAGPVEDRPEYLKSVLLSRVLSSKRERMSETVTNAYQAGAGMRLRNYHRWSRTHFKQVGVPADRFVGKPRFNAEVVAAALLSSFDITAAVDWIDSGASQIDMWGRQWLREFMPEKEPTDTWTVDFIEATGEGLISFKDGTSPVVFTPLGYKPDGEWLYVSYSRPKTVNRWTTPQLLIYRRGSDSPAMDALFLQTGTVGEYLPFIPIRHETEFLSESYKPEVYAEAKKAYKKATGAKFSDLIDKISDNDDLDEIDYAYVVFGVSLNIKDLASLRYVFSYFKYLMNNALVQSSTYQTWYAAQPAVNVDVEAWRQWVAAQNANPAGSALTGPEPTRPLVMGAPSNSVVIEDKGPGKTNMKMEITWNSITHVILSGLGKAGAKPGDVWFTFGNSQTIDAKAYTEEQAEELNIELVEMYHQRSVGFYEKLTIRGLKHINHIYDGKSVEITAAQALVDVDESGFIVPMHYETFREISLVDATQMATQSMNIVFNCFQIVKKKWYQRGWFKVILVIAVIIVAVLNPAIGSALGIQTGLLGASATVGAALGFAGTAALVAGTVANIVAAMVLTQVLTSASVMLLGEKIGAIVGAIASFVALGVGSSLMNGGTLASAWASLGSGMNLLSLTNSVGNAYAQVINADTMDIVRQSQSALDDYRKQSLELQENYAEQFGYGTAVFNPMALTEVGESFFTEDADTFLSRTLMTGSDIAQMGNDLITNFVELTLQNEFKE